MSPGGVVTAMLIGIVTVDVVPIFYTELISGKEL